MKIIDLVIALCIWSLINHLTGYIHGKARMYLWRHNRANMPTPGDVNGNTANF